ncbi:MAG: hypothetical protein ACOYOQ_06030 [Microthrixaceae bacterium]
MSGHTTPPAGTAPWSADGAPAAVQPVPDPPAEVRVVDAEDLARLAAETVALIEHHRAELHGTMAELTALQRAVRSELRTTLAEVRALADRLDPAGAVDPGDG